MSSNAPDCTVRNPPTGSALRVAVDTWLADHPEYRVTPDELRAGAEIIEQELLRRTLGLPPPRPELPPIHELERLKGILENPKADGCAQVTAAGELINAVQRSIDRDWDIKAALRLLEGPHASIATLVVVRSYFQGADMSGAHTDHEEACARVAQNFGPGVEASDVAYVVERFLERAGRRALSHAYRPGRVPDWSRLASAALEIGLDVADWTFQLRMTDDDPRLASQLTYDGSGDYGPESYDDTPEHHDRPVQPGLVTRR